MYKSTKIAIVIPAYNESLLINKTIDTMPEFVDYIVCVNDGSTDNTLGVLKKSSQRNKRIIIVNNEKNMGVGYTVVNGFKKALELQDVNLIGVMAGDAQCDPSYLDKLIDPLIEENFDYVKANRFYHREALKSMPLYRRIGNIFITLLTKFSTGYYSIFDTQNGYGVFNRSILEKIEFGFIGNRYDYENTLLISLSIAGAKIKDVAVPAIYGDETSTIKFWPTATRALKAIWSGFWRRIYYKYILFGFHPIALFLCVGIILNIFGLFFAGLIIIEKIINNNTPTTASVMLSAIPLILGIQMLLTALIMDVYNEGN